MPRQFETRALLALSVSALGVLGWWSLDRTPPVQQIENVAIAPVHAGEEAVIRSTVYRERRCYTELQRIFFDSAGVRTTFDMQSFVSSGPLEQRDTFSQRLPIVSNAHPGQGRVRFVIAWQCNPLHSIWPIVTTIEIPVEILP